MSFELETGILFSNLSDFYFLTGGLPTNCLCWGLVSVSWCISAVKQKQIGFYETIKMIRCTLLLSVQLRHNCVMLFSSHIKST